MGKAIDRGGEEAEAEARKHQVEVGNSKGNARDHITNHKGETTRLDTRGQ
jgi:hypothetical protein